MVLPRTEKIYFKKISFFLSLFNNNNNIKAYL